MFTVPRENLYFGGLIASGWHTSSLMDRLFVEHVVSGVASLGSPGGSELRWIKPVRPGDELSIRVTIREAKRSRSKPDRGVVFFFRDDEPEPGAGGDHGICAHVSLPGKGMRRR